MYASRAKEEAKRARAAEPAAADGRAEEGVLTRVAPLDAAGPGGRGPAVPRARRSCGSSCCVNAVGAQPLPRRQLRPPGRGRGRRGRDGGLDRRSRSGRTPTPPAGRPSCCAPTWRSRWRRSWSRRWSRAPRCNATDPGLLGDRRAAGLGDPLALAGRRWSRRLLWRGRPARARRGHPGQLRQRLPAGHRRPRGRLPVRVAAADGGRAGRGRAGVGGRRRAGPAGAGRPRRRAPGARAGPASRARARRRVRRARPAGRGAGERPAVPDPPAGLARRGTVRGPVRPAAGPGAADRTPVRVAAPAEPVLLAGPRTGEVVAAVSAPAWTTSPATSARTHRPGCCSRPSPTGSRSRVRDEGRASRPAGWTRPRPRAGSASPSRSAAASPTSAAPPR